jgi:hypothetical protein
MKLGVAIATPAQPNLFKKKIIFINNFKLFCIHIHTNININISLEFIIDDYKYFDTYISLSISTNVNL